MAENLTGISPDFVRTFIRDSIEYNKLLDEQQFSDERITQSKNLAISLFNVMTPISSWVEANFPNQHILLMGTLYHLFIGEAAAAARNELNYQDGRLTVPIEEKYQYYVQLAGTYKEMFQSLSQQFKIQSNLEDGYGEVSSDYAYLPFW